jgi:cytochrome c biogenesis factor
MDSKDIAALIHPFIAIGFVFPLIGVVVHYATLTRNRRLKTKEEGGKSKISPTVGAEHLKLGRLLSNSVVVVALLGLGYPIFSKFLEEQTWTQDPLRVGFVVLMFVLTLVCLIVLNKARAKLWRGVFATLTGMALILLGCQPEVYRRGSEWYISHYHYGILASLLMIFSLAIFPDIYTDRTNRWRNVHIILNSFALLLFIGQGFTGTRDLLEIPLTWQNPYIEQLYINNCQPPAAPGACAVQPAK